MLRGGSRKTGVGHGQLPIEHGVVTEDKEAGRITTGAVDVGPLLIARQHLGAIQYRRSMGSLDGDGSLAAKLAGTGVNVFLELIIQGRRLYAALTEEEKSRFDLWLQKEKR